MQVRKWWVAHVYKNIREDLTFHFSTGIAKILKEFRVLDMIRVDTLERVMEVLRKLVSSDC